MEGSELYQKFTVNGEVIDDAPYQEDEFKPFRRNINYFEAKQFDIKLSVQLLDFIKKILIFLGGCCLNRNLFLHLKKSQIRVNKRNWDLSL